MTNKLKFIPKNRELFLKGKQKGVFDENLIHREFYNPNNFDVIFRRRRSMDTYIFNSEIPLGPIYAVLKSRDFLHLPHAFYDTEVRDKQGKIMQIQFDLIVNFGDQIGIGNKTPSTPA